MKFLLFAFIAYIAYQFIFKLVIPIYLASRKIKQGFREMNEKMNQQQAGQQDDFTRSRAETKPKSTHKAGEYIDFEEIK